MVNSTHRVCCSEQKCCICRHQAHTAQVIGTHQAAPQQSPHLCWFRICDLTIHKMSDAHTLWLVLLMLCASFCTCSVAQERVCKHEPFCCTCGQQAHTRQVICSRQAAQRQSPDLCRLWSGSVTLTIHKADCTSNTHHAQCMDKTRPTVGRLKKLIRRGVCASPDIVCRSYRLHNEIPAAAVPGPPLLGFLVEGRDVGDLADGGKHGEGGCAGALHRQVLEEVGGAAGAHGGRQHAVHSLVHSTAQACRAWSGSYTLLQELIQVCCIESSCRLY